MKSIRGQQGKASLGRMLCRPALESRDVEAVKFLMLPFPAPLEVLCFRVRFCYLTFGIFCFRFLLRIELFATAKI